MFFIGCPMWGYKEWVGNFFPAHTPSSEFLHFYSRQLNAVEGNTVFYALPSSEIIARWRQETPATFRICPKVSRIISHEAQLENVRNETMLFVERMRELGTRLGPAFLQLPPSFDPTHISLLNEFLTEWPSDVRLAVEVRNADFYTEHATQELDMLLNQYNAARVMMDIRPIHTGSLKEQQLLQARERKPNVPLHIAATTDFTFVRYIGHPRMEVNEPFLNNWSEQIEKWLKQGITVYAFCHCPYETHSPEICAALYARVNALIPQPPLAQQQEGSDTAIEQHRLF